MATIASAPTAGLLASPTRIMAMLRTERFSYTDGDVVASDCTALVVEDMRSCGSCIVRRCGNSVSPSLRSVMASRRCDISRVQFPM